jgi:hypothetical protein
MDLEFLHQKSLLRYNIIKLEVSKDEIKKKNAHRLDLISSMQQTEDDLNITYLFLSEIEKQIRMLKDTCLRLERLNLELKCDLRQLEINKQMYEM